MHLITQKKCTYLQHYVEVSDKYLQWEMQSLLLETSKRSQEPPLQSGRVLLYLRLGYGPDDPVDSI